MTKRIVSILVIMALLLMGVAAFAETLVTSGSSNLRTGPGLGYDVITAVPKGTKLTYNGENQKDSRGVTWYRVTYKGTACWTSSKNIGSSGSSDSSSSGSAGTVTTTASVNLRKGPGLGYGKVTSVSKGTKLSYTGTSQKDGRGVTWYKVTYKGKTCWVSSKYSTTGSSGGSSSGGIVTTGSVNLRKGPGLAYGKVASVSKGTHLSYTGTSQKDDRGVTWYKVTYKGSSCWVSSKYSKLN